MKGKSRSFNFTPKNVPLITFDMFGSAQNVRLPVSATAVSIQDNDIKTTFMKMSKQSKSIRQDGFKFLIERIPLVKDKEDFKRIVTTSLALFDSTFPDMDGETRALAVSLIKIVCNILEKGIVEYASKLFPILLLYICDTDKNVSTAAREIFNHYFQTPEKRNAIMSKLRNEISQRIRFSFNDLIDMEKKINGNDDIENWGRMASATINLSTNMLSATKFDYNVYTSFGDPPIYKWMMVKDGRFKSNAVPTMRIASYLYMALTTKEGIVGLDAGNRVLDFISAETSPKCQERLIKLVSVYFEKGGLTAEKIRKALLPALPLYYDPVGCGLPNLILLIANQEFVETALTQVSSTSDIQTGNLMFQVLFSLCKERSELAPSVECLFKLFSGAVAQKPATHFLAQVDLSYFVSIHSDPRVKEVLNKGKESRAIEYLSLLSNDAMEEWLKARETILPKTLLQIVKKQGTLILRKTWPSILEIPMKNATDQQIAELVLAYARTDEMQNVIEAFPSSVKYFLPKWVAGWDCLRCDKLLEMAGDILESSLGLYKILKQIFPDNEVLEKVMEEKILGEIKENDGVDPLIFEIFNPTEEILTKFLFSSSVDDVESGDKILSCLLEHIPRLLESKNQVNLAIQAHKLVTSAGIDPQLVKVSPLDAPTFCFEYWTRIGLDKLPADQFIALLDSVIQKRAPWLPVFLYIRTVDWNAIPTKFWQFITEKPELADVATKQKSLFALSSICAANDMNISYLPHTGLSLSALPNDQPPEDANDELSVIIKSEWNLAKPIKPADIKEDANVMRGIVSYLQYGTAEIYSFDDVLPLIEKKINDADRFNFFLTLRALSIMRDTDIRFDPFAIVSSVVEKVVNFAPIPSCVEKTLSSAMRVAQYLSPNNFLTFACNCGKYFETNASKYLAKQLVPLIRYFNVWDLLESRLDKSLNLELVEPWHLIVNGLLQMPYQKRVDMIPSFTKDLFSIFDKLPIDSEEFIMLISAFPSTALEWGSKLPNSRMQPLMAEMSSRGTQRVFEIVAKTIKKISLGQTTIKTNGRNMNITATYVEDETTNPISIDLTLPPIYPFKRVIISADFGNGALAKKCEYLVASAIAAKQSVDAGVFAWHDFIVREMQEKEPCTICYQYLDEQQKMPKVKCSTCGQKFHSGCLSKWFNHCLQPTCPYCASPWKPKA